MSRSKINYNDIDVGMREIIRVLNDKGWTTKYCCEGHYNDTKERYCSGYIYFEKDKVPNFPKLYDNMKLTTSCYRKCPYQSNCGDTFYWYGSAYKKLSRTDKDKEHEEVLSRISEWAEGLEKRV